MTQKITVDEWLKLTAELQKEQKENEGFTTSEFADAMHIGTDKSRMTLRALINSGKVEAILVYRVSVLTNVGRMVPGFRLKGSTQ